MPEVENQSSLTDRSLPAGQVIARTTEARMSGNILRLVFIPINIHHPKERRP